MRISAPALVNNRWRVNFCHRKKKKRPETCKERISENLSIVARPGSMEVIFEQARGKIP
jgi:hypothetical protein